MCWGVALTVPAEAPCITAWTARGFEFRVSVQDLQRDFWLFYLETFSARGSKLQACTDTREGEGEGEGERERLKTDRDARPRAADVCSIKTEGATPQISSVPRPPASPPRAYTAS